MDWLNIAKSSQAKNKIRNFLRKANKNDSLDKGKNNIANYIRKKGYDPHLVAKNAYLLRATKDLKLNNVNELYIQISNGGSSLAKLGQRLIDYYNEDNQKEELRQEEEIKKKKNFQRNSDNDGPGIIVKGADNLLIRIARCCTPVPGDPIVGFITKGRGITVHRKDCSNIVSLPEREKARLIDVEWETPKVGQTYYADITICCIDRKGMFSDISKVCEDMDVRLAGVNMRPEDVEYVSLSITVAIAGIHQIQRLLIALRNIPGVDKVYRTKS